MGNKIVRPRELADEGLSCPHASVLHKDVDHRKLRQLILNGELAPCDPGAEEYSPELDECPICFLFYPNLNRSSCCSKCICTECYLQIKAAGYTPHANCPFCKTSNYKVEYCGAKTPEEKYFEQAEEQKAIEAKIRIRQKELRDEQERRLKHGMDVPAEARYLAASRGQGLHSDVYDTQHLDQFQESFELEESQIFGQDDIHEEQGHQEFVGHLHGEGGAHLDMENVMLMKAIWLSIKDQSQESGVKLQTFHGNIMQGGGLSKKGRSLGLPDSVRSRGQVASGSESFLDQANSTYERIPDCQDSKSRSSIIKIPGRCSGVHGSMVENEIMDLGRSYSENFPSFPSQMRKDVHEVMDCLPSGTGYMIPKSYDEQIMLAVALSLADEDARGR